jgi:hypothetical protein
MLLDVIAYFLIAFVVAFAFIVLILFILLVIADSTWKEVLPLAAFALLIAGFVWALIRLGVM